MDESVTDRCQCDRAKEYEKQKVQKQKAKARIEEVFGTAAGERALDTTIVNHLVSFADIIAEKKMQAVMIDMGNGVKAKLSRTVKGAIKVERTEVAKESFEE